MDSRAFVQSAEQCWNKSNKDPSSLPTSSLQVSPDLGTGSTNSSKEIIKIRWRKQPKKGGCCGRPATTSTAQRRNFLRAHSNLHQTHWLTSVSNANLCIIYLLHFRLLQLKALPSVFLFSICLYHYPRITLSLIEPACAY